MRQASASSACYHPHLHEEFSFGVIDAGEAEYLNRDSRYSIKKGDTVTINPDEVHSCNPLQGKWSYRMLFINSEWIRKLQCEILNQNLSHYQPFSNHLETDSVFFNSFDALFKQLMKDGNLLQSETLLIDFLERCFQAQKPAQPEVNLSHDNQRLQQVKTLITEQLNHQLPLHYLAQQAGLSRYHFLRCFKHQYGLSPHAFLLDKRIEKAKKILQTGETILNTSLALGFNDQSHFQRNFKKRLAVTPKKYQSFFS
ncbi:MAG: AraC family transcriptional regulator [Candidatus Thiodiazotropha sp.]